MNDAIKLTMSNETISILELMLEASLLVQLVMALLIILSLVSWIVIFTNNPVFRAAACIEVPQLGAADSVGVIMVLQRSFQEEF